MNKSFTTSIPRLSLIVPVLNERKTVASLLQNLAEQKGITFELILCDGGSTDNTAEEAELMAVKLPFSMEILHCKRGRGRQMNAGAKKASADYLLFLHADSYFPAKDTLARAISALDSAADTRVAGHFALSFSGESIPTKFWYYFHTCKARLHRPGCTHGDQGWLLSRSFFTETGPFDESLPFLEDARLAPLIAERGQWLLFDREIVTSARRFEVEGLHRRQLLNALIMASHETGLTGLLAEMPAIYQQHKNTGALSLTPFFARFLTLSAALPPTERSRHWQAIGRFIAGNIWQIALIIDTHRSFRKGTPPEAGKLTALEFFDRHLARFVKPPPVHRILGQAARLVLAVAVKITNRRNPSA